MKEAFSLEFFDQVVFAGQDKSGVSAEARLVLAEKIWPAVGAALEALLKEGRVKQDANLFLAQHLMRHKNKVTPSQWEDWAQLERGKRLLEKLKEGTRKVFEGFTIKRVIRANDLKRVVDAVDESFLLNGEFSKAFLATPFPAGELSFEDFWPLVTHRVRLRGSLIQSGLDAKAQQQRDREKAEEDKRQEEKEKMRKAQEAAEQTKKFSDLLNLMNENGELIRIKASNNLLTGSPHLVQPYEVPVEGSHVELLISALSQLGFRGHSSVSKWSLAASRQWAAIQRTLECSVTDGVVDGESFNAFLDAGSGGFLPLRKRVRDAWEEWTEQTKEDDDLIELVYEGGKKEETAKPSYEEIALRTGMSMIRLNWLHEQFAALLPDGVDEYPENPAALSREEMRALTLELQPDMTEAEFSQKFFAIDGDGSGQIEFDEFIEWMSLENLDLSE
jgi:hypothetical protein